MYKDSVGNLLRVAVVIPSYRVSKQITQVIETLPEDIDDIIVIDDACPENSGDIAQRLRNDKVKVFWHTENRGVGGAMKTGYVAALKNGANVVVKLDGDGQMDPNQIHSLLIPLLTRKADYSKGNRFYSLRTVKSMPRVRLFGNVVLSFLSKISTGFYQIFDPNNGFTAISAGALNLIEFSEIDERYFFESDMLYQINSVGLQAVDVPMTAIYGEEVSNLRVGHSIFYFLVRHTKNAFKRIILTYFVRDFSVATLQLALGLAIGTWGTILGFTSWLHSMNSGTPSQPGTIVLVAILCITGLQLLLSFINYDISLSRRDKS
jgi:glycosyltransferase involved in cell wall biosynthesis